MLDNLVKNCKGDLMEARPTLMAGVPVLWERIRKGAQEKINAAPSLRQAIFHTAYNIKYWLLQHNIASAPGLDQVRGRGERRLNEIGRLCKVQRDRGRKAERNRLWWSTSLPQHPPVLALRVQRPLCSGLR